MPSGGSGRSSPTRITSRAFKADPFPFYSRMRQEQPVCRVRWSGRREVWLVTRYDDATALLKDRRFVKDPRNVAGRSAQQPWMPGFLRPLQLNMLDQDEPAHRRLRQLVQKAFTPRRVEGMRQSIETIAADLLATVGERREVDLVRAYARPLPLRVISDLLGVPWEDRDRFHRWTRVILRPPTPPNMVRALPSIAAFMRYLKRLFARRRSEPGDDLISALLAAEAEGDRLGEDELLAMVFLLLVAGHETTVNLIASGTLALLEHPDQLELLRREPELISSAVEELLRFVSPVDTSTERYAREDLGFGGAAIGRGEMVLAALASANRDPSRFEAPDALDLRRQPNHHLAFGDGPHFCLGASLARLEAQIALALLVRELPGLRLAVAPARLRWRPTPMVRGLETLPVLL